jgi:hypothetical protein
MREDTDLADIDRLARQYTGKPYPQRDRGRISAWIAVDGWRRLRNLLHLSAEACRTGLI